MESKAQKEANKRWKQKHKDRQRYYAYRSAAKTFIKSLAKLPDLKLIKSLLDKRLNQLK